MMTNLSPRRSNGLPWKLIIIVVLLITGVAVFAYYRGWLDRIPSTSSAAVDQVKRAVAPTPAPKTQPVAPAQPVKAVTKAAPETAPIAPVAQVAPVAPAAPPTQTTNAGQVDRALAQIPTDPVEARRVLTQAVESGQLSGSVLATAIDGIATTNRQLFFAPVADPRDPLMTTFAIRKGDTLAKIARDAKLDGDWRLLQRLNGIKDERRITAGQTLKVPQGTFHAVVHKNTFRMDVFLDNGKERAIIASFPIGLGELNSTPIGVFRVRKNSKLVDPEWRNPRTGEFFESSNPKNPIGDHWIGLQGHDDNTKNFIGYGIHGTVDPSSIGAMASMGCIRMHAADVAFVYELLTEPSSTIAVKD